MIKDIVTEINEDDFNVKNGGQVEIIGWIYQYYNTELHDEVVNISGGAVQKNDIPAATQLFTTDWVVRYMVDNSLGKYWLERHPNSSLKNDLKYLLPEKIITVPNDEDIQDIKFVDNAMGSGHILIYAFDVLMKIYQEEGYSARDAAVDIITKNLYGLEIDQRAYQLATFSLMMKARQYNRRILRKSDIKPNLHVFVETDEVSPEFLESVPEKSRTDIEELIGLFKDAKELGSIIRIEKDYDFDKLRSDITGIKETGIDLYGIQSSKELILKVLDLAEVISAKYDVVVTNPPYLNKMDKNLKKYVKKHFSDYSGDLFSVFIYNNINWLKPDGYSAYMTPFVWMFIKTYEKLRTFIVENKKISSLIQMEYSAFEEATVPINTFVIKNSKPNDEGIYLKLSDFKGGMEIQNQKVLEAIENPDCGYVYRTNQANFSKIPGNPIAYWANLTVVNDFENNENIEQFAHVGLGMRTGNNKRFLRQWFEINKEFFNPNLTDYKDTLNTTKWVPYNKGGNFRKWFGNNSYVVNWYQNGKEIKDDTRRKYPELGDDLSWKITNEPFFFNQCISWTFISSSNFGVRYYDYGSIFDVAGSSIFVDDISKLLYIEAFLNSKVAFYLLKMLNPTLNFQVINIKKLPIIFNNIDTVYNVIRKLTALSKKDWDSFETSWDFQRHPLLNHIADDKQLFSAKLLEYSYVCAKIVTIVPFGGLK